MRYNIKNIVNHDGKIKNCTLAVGKGIVSDIRPGYISDAETFHYAIPGFIDIHTHGGDGFELMDNSPRALDAISRFYLRNGTTSFLTSTVTDSLDKTAAVLETVRAFLPHNRELSRKAEQAECLGVHLEGPWLSMKNLGAQNPEYCIVPGTESLALIEKFRDIVKMVTFSYHTLEAQTLLEFLNDRGIVAACGHDETIDERITEGFQKGIKVVTHIYCVCSSFQRVNGLKHLGTVEVALMTDGVKVEVISDGHHITKYFWDFIVHNKSYDDILIVSDSMRCAGMPEDPEKTYKLGEIDVIVDNGVAWLKDKSAFAGSVATMYSNFRNLVQNWGVDISDAVKITSYNQPRLFNLDHLGEIKAGRKADILLLDKNLSVCKIIKNGIEVPGTVSKSVSGSGLSTL